MSVKVGVDELRVEVLDAQLHVWEADHADRPWDREAATNYFRMQRAAGLELDEADVVSDAKALAAMDEVGVDAAVLVTFASLYGVDNSYALEAAARHPGRFAVVGRLEAHAPDIGDQVTNFAESVGTVGLRALLTSDEECELTKAGAYDRLFAATQDQGLVLCVYPTRCVADVAYIATRFSELRIVVDHLGMATPPMPVRDAEPFRRLPELLALARFPNVAVKLSAAPTLSRRPFPFEDLWCHIHAVLDAFGAQRVMWGSDTTRTGLTYEQELHYVSETTELSTTEKSLILGGSLRRVFRWPSRA